MLKSLNFTKRKTKLYTQTLHAVTLFVLVGFASDVSISTKVKINFYIRPPFCRAIKLSCTVISHARALLSCKRDSRGTIGPIKTSVYENWILNIGYHMRGEVISVLSLEGRYHKCHEWAQRTRDIYDIVLRAIKLISPRPECDNLFITYYCLDQGQKTYYILKINISPM